VQLVGSPPAASLIATAASVRPPTSRYEKASATSAAGCAGRRCFLQLPRARRPSTSSQHSSPSEGFRWLPSVSAIVRIDCGGQADERGQVSDRGWFPRGSKVRILLRNAVNSEEQCRIHTAPSTRHELRPQDAALVVAGQLAGLAPAKVGLPWRSHGLRWAPYSATARGEDQEYRSQGAVGVQVPRRRRPDCFRKLAQFPEAVLRRWYFVMSTFVVEMLRPP